jgi:hypothetical protein
VNKAKRAGRLTLPGLRGKGQGWHGAPKSGLPELRRQPFGAKAGSKSATVDFDVCAFAQPASGVSFMTIAMIALRTAATLSESFLDSAKPANVKQLSA